jgi:hypothetical protein
MNGVQVLNPPGACSVCYGSGFDATGKPCGCGCKPLAHVAKLVAEFTGSDVNYYLVPIAQPKRAGVAPYTAECEDIIEALGMTFAEGCAFKAIWRSCAARTLGKKKAGQDEEGVYDAEKVVYYGGRMLAQRTKAKEKAQRQDRVQSSELK